VIDATTWTEAWRDYNAEWKRFNDVLYGLALESPAHDDLATVVAKVGLISRSYSAGVARHAADGGGDVVVARHLHRNRRHIDALVGEVRSIAIAEDVPTIDSMVDVVWLHGEFCRLLRGSTRDGNSLPSFASKYLHFHAPGVPIYDSRAAWRIRQGDMYPFRGRRMRRFEPPVGGDYRYYKFCNQVLALAAEAVALDLPVTTRRLDQFLLYLADTGQ